MFLGTTPPRKKKGGVSIFEGMFFFCKKKWGRHRWEQQNEERRNEGTMERDNEWNDTTPHCPPTGNLPNSYGRQQVVGGQAGR